MIALGNGAKLALLVLKSSKGTPETHAAAIILERSGGRGRVPPPVPSPPERLCQGREC
jgi:hypothetical protein